MHGVITLEEHFSVERLTEDWRGWLRDRLRAMDAASVEICVLGLTSSANSSNSALAVANMTAARACAGSRGRILMTALVPAADPRRALDIVTRAADEAVVVGIALSGRLSINSDRFDAVYAEMAQRQLPLIAPDASSLHDGSISARLSTAPSSMLVTAAGLGPQVQPGLAIDLIVSGILDRHTDLQIVLGDQGEGLLYWIAHLDRMMAKRPSQVRHPASYYLGKNFTFAISGAARTSELRGLITDVSLSRIIVAWNSADSAGSIQRLAGTIPAADRGRILADNAESLFAPWGR